MISKAATGPLVFVGTYTEPLPPAPAIPTGIVVYRLEHASGRLIALSAMTDVVNPTYLALHPYRPVLYAVQAVETGSVRAFRIDAQSGTLSLLDEQNVSGSGPAHLCVDPTGRWLLVANYGSGSITLLPIRDDGSLAPPQDTVQHQGHGVDKERQEGPHAHFITTDPDNRFVLVADLGLDQVLVYRVDDAAGKLIPNDRHARMRPGSGPRHLAFHPNGRFVYVIHELDSTLATCTYDANTGGLRELQHVSTLPGAFSGKNTTAAVRVAPSGRFVYGSNRGHDSIAVFAVDETTGMLTPIEHVPTQGATPRDFNIDSSGSMLLAANQDSDSIVSFRVDATSGRLTPTGQAAEAMRPVCIVIADNIGDE